MNLDQITLFIPIKQYSTRVKDKTTKPFYGTKNIFEIKLAQALHLFSPDQIVITTDWLEASKTAENFGVRTQLIPNLSHYHWSESLKEMLKECRKSFFCIYRATTPFLDEDFLKDFLDDFFSEQDFDSAVTVLKIQERLLDGLSRPLNFSIGHGHLDSQETDPIYKEICGISIIPKELAQSCTYHYGKKPKLFVVDQLNGVDINTEEDWHAAQTLTQISSFEAKL